jgi:hypothetical protein
MHQDVVAQMCGEGALGSSRNRTRVSGEPIYRKHVTSLHFDNVVPVKPKEETRGTAKKMITVNLDRKYV